VTAIIVLLAIAATVAFDGRQGQRRERAADALKRYHALVDGYRSGDDDTVRTILEWDVKRLDDVITIAQTTADPLAPWPDERFKAAAMLHTDTAVSMLNSDRPGFAIHLDMASRLLAKAGPRLQPFARLWYSIVARVLRDQARLIDAEVLLERGRQRLPGDGLVLYESGVFQEEMATFTALGRESPGPSGRGVHQGSSRIGSATATGTNIYAVEWRRTLEKAATWLEASIKADPTLSLPPLHLGRVEMLLDRDGRALKRLQGISVSPADRSSGYLADLFIGALHERRGRYDQAQRAYGQAIARLPANQSGYLALSGLLQRLGRGDESRAVATRVLLEPKRDTFEPWWWYLSDPPAQVQSRLNGLRAVARQ
jgi:tetratricopeptide (TPR) repeat protein